MKYRVVFVDKVDVDEYANHIRYVCGSHAGAQVYPENRVFVDPELSDPDKVVRDLLQLPFVDSVIEIN